LENGKSLISIKWGGVRSDFRKEQKSVNHLEVMSQTFWEGIWESSLVGAKVCQNLNQALARPVGGTMFKLWPKWSLRSYRTGMVELASTRCLSGMGIALLFVLSLSHLFVSLTQRGAVCLALS
jgi:hypothetical protein